MLTEVAHLQGWKRKNPYHLLLLHATRVSLPLGKKVHYTSMISFSLTTSRFSISLIYLSVSFWDSCSPRFRSSSEKCSCFSDFLRCSIASRRTFRTAIFPSSPNFFTNLTSSRRRSSFNGG